MKRTYYNCKLQRIKSIKPACHIGNNRFRLIDYPGWILPGKKLGVCRSINFEVGVRRLIIFGVGVCRSVDLEDSKPYPTNKWCIIHLYTGHYIGRLDLSFKEAVQKGLKLESLYDFNSLLEEEDYPDSLINELLIKNNPSLLS